MNFCGRKNEGIYRITNGVKPGTAMLYIVFNNWAEQDS